jgi:hypothetical protein
MVDEKSQQLIEDLRWALSEVGVLVGLGREEPEDLDEYPGAVDEMVHRRFQAEAKVKELEGEVARLKESLEVEPSETEIEELRAEILALKFKNNRLLQQLEELPATHSPRPRPRIFRKPRYDKTYFNGVEWLDKQGGADLNQGDEAKTILPVPQGIIDELTKCHEIALKLAAETPEDPDGFTGSVSERLIRGIENLKNKVE